MTLYPGYPASKTGDYLVAEQAEAKAAGAHAYDDGTSGDTGLVRLAWPDGFGDPPSIDTIEGWGPAPVTDVERAAAALAARRRTREDVIFSDTAGLVATCYAWLQRECAVPGGGTDTKTASQALQAGQGLCSTQGYGLALRAWIDFAASDFYTALSSPDATRPWLEWVPAGEPKSIREAILDRVYLATYGVPRP